MAVHGSTEFDVDAPAALVMEILLDVEALPEWSGPHQRAEILESDDDGRPTTVRLQVSVSGISDNEVLRYSWTDTTCSWELVESDQLRSQLGRYTVTEKTSDTCHVEFSLEVDLKIKLPGIVVRQGQRIALDTAKKGLIAEARRRQA